MDERSDIYAIGAIAFELLCGRRMFTGRTFLSRREETPRGDGVSRNARGARRVARAGGGRSEVSREEARESFLAADALAASFEALERLQEPRRTQR